MQQYVIEAHRETIEGHPYVIIGSAFGNAFAAECREHVTRNRVLRLDGQPLLEHVRGFRTSAAHIQNVTEAVVGACMGGIQRKGLPISPDRLREIATVAERVPKVVISVGKRRSDLD